MEEQKNQEQQNSVSNTNNANNNNNQLAPEVHVEIKGDLVEQILKVQSENIEDKIKIALQKGTELAKQQLYPEISRLKNKIAELEQSTKNTIDPKMIETLAKEKAELENKLKIVEDSLVKTTTDLEQLNNKITVAELNAYRNKLIAENKGNIVESLVRGNSIEELNASLEIAKNEFKKIEESLKSQYRIPERPINNVPANDEPLVVNRIGFNKNEIIDWEAKRKEILTKVYEQARQKLGYTE